MNALSALLLWMLSQLAPGEIVCQQYDLPESACEEQQERAPAALDPDRATQSERDETDRRQRRDHPRVRTNLDPARINNGF